MSDAKLTQEKPEVIGYEQVEFAGDPFVSFSVWSKDLASYIALSDLTAKGNPHGLISKFRPVYKSKL